MHAIWAGHEWGPGGRWLEPRVADRPTVSESRGLLHLEGGVARGRWWSPQCVGLVRPPQNTSGLLHSAASNPVTPASAQARAPTARPKSPCKSTSFV
jgi:hypothetical protein